MRLYLLKGCGEFYKEDEYPIPPLSQTLHYSAGIFEGMSIYGYPSENGFRLGLFHPSLNLERLRWGIQELGFPPLKCKDEEIISGIFQLAVVNGFHRRIPQESAMNVNGELVYRLYVRPLIYDDSNGIGFRTKPNNTLMIAIVPFGKYIKYPREGINVLLSNKPRETAFPMIKTSANYMQSIEGKILLEKYNEINDMKAHEVIFTNTSGSITEATGENVIFIKGNSLYTAPPKQGALPGITYRIIFKIAQELGLRTKFRAIRYEEIENMDAIFLTGNAAGIVPVNKVIKTDENLNILDYEMPQEGVHNRVLSRLMHEYNSIILGNTRYGHLITYMNQWLKEEEIKQLEEKIEYLPINREYAEYESNSVLLKEEMSIKKYLL